MTAIIRARFELTSIEQHASARGVTVKMRLRQAETLPAGSLLTGEPASGGLWAEIEAPELVEGIALGQQFYVDLTPIEEGDGAD